MHLSAAARPTFYAAHRAPHLRHALEIHAVRMRLVCDGCSHMACRRHAAGLDLPIVCTLCVATLYMSMST